jgi:hypothetical protein
MSLPIQIVEGSPVQLRDPAKEVYQLNIFKQFAFAGKIYGLH